MARTKSVATKLSDKTLSGGVSKKRLVARTLAGRAGKTVLPTKTGDDKGEKRPRRWRPGTVALREIKKYQKSTGPLVPAAAFGRCIREEALGINGDIRFTREALETIREAAETCVVDLFTRTMHLVVAGKARTLQKRHLHATAAVTGDMLLREYWIRSTDKARKKRETAAGASASASASAPPATDSAAVGGA